MRHQPRQIYTSVRSPRGLSGATPTTARRLVVAVLLIVAVATIAVVILSIG